MDSAADTSLRIPFGGTSREAMLRPPGIAGASLAPAITAWKISIFGNDGAQERGLDPVGKTKTCRKVRPNSVSLKPKDDLEGRPAAEAYFKPIKHSVYFGRELLGRYVQTDCKKFKASDANDRPLGGFRVRARALAAIRKAARGGRS